MSITIDYDKLVKSNQTQEGSLKETSILSTVEGLKNQVALGELPKQVAEKYTNFLRGLYERGARTVEQALKQFLADYLTDGCVGCNVNADQEHINEQFFKFTEKYFAHSFAYIMGSGAFFFPKFTAAETEYDWGAILDLVDRKVLEDKFLYTSEKYHLESYLFLLYDFDTYNKEINSRVPEITLGDIEKSIKQNKEQG